MADDRREFQRLRLAKPILALMNGQSALVLDIGIAGAFLEHYGTMESGERFRLVFRWKGQDVEFDCEVARSSIVRSPGGDGQSSVSHSGVRFTEAVGESRERLQDMMATFVGKVLAAQKANATGAQVDKGDELLAQLGEARRLRSRGFVSYRLKGGSWWRVPTASPQQPPDGFTVAAYEDEEELETLCRAYEASDEEGRRLIRLVSELSALSVRKR
ncbi:MAG TPA: PilZ domain-containing protein [Thermoanaerobaculia bacterium]|nr:PilZ domain-containing protein [Thermoanaerobaculia bacterium]